MMIATAYDNDHWVDALAGVGLGEEAPAPAPDLGLFFASPLYPDLETLMELVYRRSAASVLVGCTGHGVIANRREIEGRPGMAMLNLMLPATELFPVHVEDRDLASLRTPPQWREALGVAASRVNAWLVIGDPYTFDTERCLRGLQTAYPDTVITGGLATGLPYRARTWHFLNDRVYRSGALLVGIGGGYTIRPLVAQGVVPIGREWTVTAVEDHRLLSLDGRPAYQALEETLDGLDDEMRERAIKGVLVGLADPPPAQHPEPSFLVRALTASDWRAGSLSLNAPAQVGQRLQFQVRHARAAEENLRRELVRAREELRGRAIAGALLCSANRRGVGLFGAADHDAQTVADVFGDLPLGGFVSAGEIGPAGSRAALHGSTATLAFFVKR